MTPRLDRFLRRLHLARVAEHAAVRAHVIAETEAALADTVDAIGPRTLPARWTRDGLVLDVPVVREDWPAGTPPPVLLTDDEWAAYGLPEVK
jgi:hypothetical protein